MQALVSLGLTSDISRCLPLVLQLSDFLAHCDLSYTGLLTGHEVDMISKQVIGGEFYCPYICTSRAIFRYFAYNHGEIHLSSLLWSA